MSRDEHSVERLSAYLDGALSEAERLEVEAHLAGCEECRRILDDLRTLSADLRAERVPEVPLDLERRIRRALDAERGRGTVVPFSRRWRIPATIAATLGAIALVALSFRFLPLESRAPAGFAERARIEVPVETPGTPGPPSPEPPPAPPVPEKAAKTAWVRDEKAEVVAGVAAEADRTELGVTSETNRAAPTPERVAAAADEQARRAAPPALYRSTITIPPGPECEETAEPFEAPLRATAGDLEAIARFVETLGGGVVSTEGRPFARKFEVQVDRWPRLLEHLSAQGFVAETDPKEIPPGANCVRVRVEVIPSAP